MAVEHGTQQWRPSDAYYQSLVCVLYYAFRFKCTQVTKNLYQLLAFLRSVLNFVLNLVDLRSISESHTHAWISVLFCLFFLKKNAAHVRHAFFRSGVRASMAATNRVCR
eukprot:SAG31_NODE_4565_length_3132_cov_2.438510_1_plen_108_part_10